MKAIAVASAALALILAGQPASAQYRNDEGRGGDRWENCREGNCRGDRDDHGRRDEHRRWEDRGQGSGGCVQVRDRSGRVTCRDGQAWSGNDRYARGSITLYGAPGYDGQLYGSDREITNLPREYNDRAMSLRIEGPYAWQVCSDKNFHGHCETFDRGVVDLRRFGLGERVTSARPVR